MTTLAAGSRGLAVAARDKRAGTLEDCFQECGAELVGYLVTLVGDVNLAQDFAQEAFVELFSRWRTVRHPRAYVYMTATNLARGYWRKREREGRAFATVSRVSTDNQAEHDPWLWDLVSRLDEPQRQPVLLHYYADLPIAEVARLLRLPEGTVKRRLHEARRHLLSVLEDNDG